MTSIKTNDKHDETLKSINSSLNFDRTSFRFFQMPITFSDYLSECVLPGLGLFGESYLLFSMGTLKPLWDELYPRCLGGYSCPLSLIYQISFSIIFGIICGMISIGLLSSVRGRRTGSILTASLMCSGSIGLLLITVALSNFPLTLFRCMMVLLFVFGIGVGGEYPLSASSASERAMAEFKLRCENELNDDHYESLSPTRDQKSISIVESKIYNSFRGGRILLVFAMQGIGVFIQSLVLCFLLYIALHLGENNHGNYFTDFSLLTIWRIIYLIGTIILIYVYRFRINHLHESKVWEDNISLREEIKNKKNDHERGDFVPPPNTNEEDQSYSNTSSSFPLSNKLFQNSCKTHLEIKLLWDSFGVRLIGTSISWLLWDVAFYGNKLYQSTFLLSLKKGGTTLLNVTELSALNAFVALLGYFAAAAVVDDPTIGRLRLQKYGLLITGSLYILCGLLREVVPTNWLIFLYLTSSFFGQFGPNCTTFLIPAEIFPTEGRTVCHGISAGAGKVGALLAAVLFHFVTETGMFFICGWCTLLAYIVTYITLPDVTNLDLFEIDRKWMLTLDGREKEYTGPANHENNLSYYEKKIIASNRRFLY